MNNTKQNKNYRDKSIVMQDLRLGAMHQTRISFVRHIVRKIANEDWNVSCTLWDMDASGFGTVIYTITTDYSEYNFVVFSQYIEDDERNDRVIAEKWDVTFSFTQGKVDKDLLEQMRKNVPLQEAGRNTSKSLVLARANKSVRVFDYIVDNLKQGVQPDISVLAECGYILRTTAVYGNGKFGIADFDILKNNPDFKDTFSPQMCACYLLRQFSIDWVNHIAKQNSDTAIELDDSIATYMGTGNATGLGMAPYLIKHPQVVDMWLTTREEAITRVSNESITDKSYNDFIAVLKDAIQHLSEITTIDENQGKLNTTTINELTNIVNGDKPSFNTWKDFVASTTNLSLETQEIILSSIIEIYPELVDELSSQLNAVESLTLADDLSIGDMQKVLNENYKWATEIDFSKDENNYWFWYRSETKEEPRLGVRKEEEGSEKESPLDIARQVNTFNNTIKDLDKDMQLAEFLINNPSMRTIARRIWTMGNSAMGDIQMNVLSKNMLPMHLLRCKLSMFGATKFDPRSDKWVQVTLFQGAPLLKNVKDNKSWLFPLMPKVK
ncbi:MAG: hypothetical protein ACPG8V_02825 [Alphaproteobacteria bacterium]